MLLINRVMRRRKEGGAALVEFAVMAPFLVLLLLGMIEFGYKFGQYNEVRHAARETARYAAVSNPDRTGDGSITDADVMQVCNDSFNLPNSTAYVQAVVIDSGGTVLAANTQGLQGQSVRVTVTALVPALSGAPIISSFLPTLLSNTVELRIEQDTTWHSLNFDTSAFNEAVPNWPAC